MFYYAVAVDVENVRNYLVADSDQEIDEISLSKARENMLSGVRKRLKKKFSLRRKTHQVRRVVGGMDPTSQPIIPGLP